MEEADPSPPVDETATVDDDAADALAAALGDAPDADPAPLPSEAPPPESVLPRVLLTGAANFVGIHVLNELLKSNKYSVRAPLTRRSKNLNDLWPPDNYPLQVILTDIWKETPAPSLLADCAYVIHSGTPYVQNGVSDSENLDYFIKGTLNLLKAARAIGTVKRFIFVSSIGAVTGPAANCTNKTYTEEDWPNLEEIPVRSRGKANVEMEAWKYVRSFPAGECFQLTVVNPACVMGPLLTKVVAQGRVELHRQLMEHKLKRVPNFFLPIVDVRDVAVAILNALTAQEAANKRHLLAAENIWYLETAKILSDEFSKYGYDVPTKKASYMYLWFNGMFDKKVRKWLPIINKEFKLDNTRMKTVLGVTPRKINTTLIDMGYSLIETGLVKKATNYHGRHSV